MECWIHEWPHIAVIWPLIRCEWPLMHQIWPLFHREWPLMHQIWPLIPNFQTPHPVKAVLKASEVAILHRFPSKNEQTLIVLKQKVDKYVTAKVI